MGFYQIYKLDDPADENSNGTFVGMVAVDTDLGTIGRIGSGEGFDENGILHHWAPLDGHIAVKHPEGENQPEAGTRRWA